jgi:uncharacterized protein (TIGR02145 family)
MKKTLLNKILAPVIVPIMAVTMSFSSCTPDPIPDPTPINKAPTAIGSVDKTSGKIGDTFTFNSSSSTDDGDKSKMTAKYDFDGDGIFDTQFAPYNVPVAHQFNTANTYTPIVQVKDDKGKTANGTISPIKIAGNMAPTVSAVANKGSAKTGETVTFTVNADDSDGENSRLESRLDADGNGTFETGWSTSTSINYSYTAAVNANPVIEVRDDEGATASTTLPNLGVWATEADKPQIDILAPRYIVAGEEIIVRTEATDKNNRPLTYSFDYGEGSVVEGSEQDFTYPASAVGKRTLEARVTNDYNISNTKTKEVEVGSEREYTVKMTDAADGKEYKVKWMKGKSGTYNLWMVDNFAGKVGDATYYENDSVNNQVFGRYYSAAEVDQIGERIMILDGLEYKAHVATTDEWDELREAYGGYVYAGGKVKYPEFYNEENVGATNESGMSMMLNGSYNGPGGWRGKGEWGLYHTAKGSDLNDTYTAIRINSYDAVMARGPASSTSRYPTRLIIEPNQY